MLVALGATIAAVVLALAIPALAHAGPSQFLTGLQDPLDPAFQDPDASHALPEARKQHVSFIRVPVAWSSVAPARPEHARDFRDGAYNWSDLDRRVRQIRQHGLQPILVLYSAPAWAKYGNGETPKTAPFGDFAAAVAKRYNGGGGRPRVRYFQIWNEANIYVYFGRTNMAAHYRDLVNAAYKPIHSAARGNKVIAGGFGPIGGKFSVSPLRMMRDVLCVSAGSHPRATCSTKVAFDVWSHHPYTSGGPNHRAARRDDVELGDLAKMRKLLTAAHRLHRIASGRKPAFWITEFSWDTNGPDPGGVPLKQHARWVAEAFYRMWANGVSMVSWFQLRDAPIGQGWGYTWQAGLFQRTTTLYRSEKQKPVAQVIRFPFAAVPSGGRVAVWGRTPRGKRASVVIERKAGGSWKRVRKLRAGRHGVFFAKLGGLRGKLVRARVGGATARPFKAVRTPDRSVRPFGGGAGDGGGGGGGGDGGGGVPPPDGCVVGVPLPGCGLP